MNRAQFKKLLVPGLNAIFGMEYKDYPEEWRQIFMVETSEKAFEEDVLLVGLGTADVKQEGASIQFDEGYQAWRKMYHHETVGLGFRITEEAVEDNLYGSLSARYTKSLKRSMMHTKEIKAANILNRGFNSSYAGGDGKEAFATDHPLRGGGTFANELTTPADLSEAALEDIVTGIGNFVDDRGLPVEIQAKKLIIPNGLQWQAERILMSNQRSGTADNDLNALKSMSAIPEGFAVNHRLTDLDAFFVITNCPEGFKHFVRRPLKTATEGDFDTGDFKYKATERYSFGWTDPRGGFASAGA